MHDRDNVPELSLEGRVEIGAALECGQAVRVGKFGEHADVRTVLKLQACRETDIRQQPPVVASDARSRVAMMMGLMCLMCSVASEWA
jgi:hypothetical protein